MLFLFTVWLLTWDLLERRRPERLTGPTWLVTGNSTDSRCRLMRKLCGESSMQSGNDNWVWILIRMDARRETTVRPAKQVRGHKVRMVKRPQESFIWSMRLSSLYEQVALRNEAGNVAIDDCVLICYGRGCTIFQLIKMWETVFGMKSKAQKSSPIIYRSSGPTSSLQR